MKELIKNVLHRLPHISSIHQQVVRQGRYPAGHYYSPIPSQEDVLGHLQSRESLPLDLPDIQLNKESQFQTLQSFQRFYDELPFPEKQSPDCRYYFDQPWFCYADAIFLYSFLRQEKPRRIVEVGSGFSSAIILDTVERFLPQRPEITFIEPDPERLNSLLRQDDRRHARVLTTRVQDVPSDVMTSLEPGDLLFIDSSHVVKCGSDLSFLMFRVLPKLTRGVFVHFHDVFYPFEYPPEWLEAGTYWNESYFLRAFLAYNTEWTIHFFGNYAGFAFEEFIAKKMPLCRRNLGGSLYIRRV